MFYPTDPSKEFGLFALRLGKYKAHFYTRGTGGFIFPIRWHFKKLNHPVRLEVFWFLTPASFPCQVPPTVILLQTKTAPYSQPSRPTTPLLYLTWRLTPQSATLSPWWEILTCKPCWRGSWKWRGSLKPPWCLEKARYPKDRTQTWNLAAILSVAPSPAAASVDGTTRSGWRCGTRYRCCTDYCLKTVLWRLIFNFANSFLSEERISLIFILTRLGNVKYNIIPILFFIIYTFSPPHSLYIN